MFRGSVRDIIKPKLYRNRSDTIFAKLPGCNRNINELILINRMNIFSSSHMNTVTIMAIMGAIAIVTIVASSTLTIYSTMTMTTPTI